MTQTMRRKDRALAEQETLEVLHSGEYGIMATVGSDGAPYAVPLSYVFWNNAIYFHCALDGRKVTNLTHCPKVSFSVVTGVEAVYDTSFSTYFNSAIVDGIAEPVTADPEKTDSLLAIAEKYLPQHIDKADASIQKYHSRTAVYKIVPSHISGKAKKKKS